MTAFHDLYGRPPETTADAPGRVNLIGEHTDYNGGFVLPTAIPQRARIEIALRTDGTVRAASRGVAVKPETYEIGAETPGRDWLDYLQGATRLLRERGVDVPGFDLLLTSDVPVGSGLSSSAALLVALFRALREAVGFELNDVDVARLSQRVENEFVGAHVGIMDQMASSLAGSDAALFLDTRSLDYRRIPLPTGRVELAVVNSGVTHSHAHGGYNTRRAECEEAARLLGVGLLRELDETGTAPGPALARTDALPDVLRRRVRHVVTENARVVEAVVALEAGDLERLGALFAASHASMRDDYEVSVPEVDRLVALLQAEPGVYGARLTGGGFGGSVVAVCRPGEAAQAAARASAALAAETGRETAVLVPAA
ncbi:MAG TPA: galactokinase [Rubricoccaceae bacterium]|jgi:galactokinase